MGYRGHRNPLYVLVVLFVCILLVTGCSTFDRKQGQLSQVSVLNALLLGEYDGFVSVKTLKSFGTIGIGTFDTLDGEMIMLDGKVYQAKADGTVLPVKDAMLVPFAMVTGSSSNVAEVSLSSVSGIEALKSRLDEIISQTTNDFNRFYAVKLEGSFHQVRVRSVPSQKKPYQHLATIAATQKEYAYEDIEGTIVAFRCPEYVNGINMPSWHLHFLSADTSKGGHLLQTDIDRAELEMGDMTDYHVLLPSSESFASMNIVHDLSEETLAVEGVTKQ